MSAEKEPEVHNDPRVFQLEDVKRFDFSPSLERLGEYPWTEVGLCCDQADEIAIRARELGEGAERVVYGLQVHITRRTLFAPVCMPVVCPTRGHE